MTGHNNPWYPLGKKKKKHHVLDSRNIFLLKKKGNTTRSISCGNIAKKGHKKLYPYLAAELKVAIQGL